MTRTYTILATNGELLSSPYIHGLKNTYDFVLEVGEPTIINFLFQFPINRSEANQISTLFDEKDIRIEDVYIDCYSQQTMISTTITAKEIGALKIAFAIPAPHLEPARALAHAHR